MAIAVLNMVVRRGIFRCPARSSCTFLGPPEVKQEPLVRIVGRGKWFKEFGTHHEDYFRGVMVRNLRSHIYQAYLGTVAASRGC